MKESLLAVADEVCGRTKGPPRHRVTWWWNEEVVKAVGEKRRLFKIWKKSKNGVDKAKAEVDRALYCSAKRSAKRAVYLAQSEQHRVFGEMLESEFENGTLFRAVKQMVGKNRDVVGAGCVKGLDGRIVTDEAEIKERSKDCYDKLLNEEFEWNKEGFNCHGQQGRI